MMYKLTFVPTLRNTLAVKTCVLIKSADSIEELSRTQYEAPNPLEWMLESIEEL